MHPHAHARPTDTPAAIPVTWFSKGWQVAIAMATVIMAMASGGILVWEAGQRFGTWQEQQKVKDETFERLQRTMATTQEQQANLHKQLEEVDRKVEAIGASVDRMARRLATMDGAVAGTEPYGPER